MFRYHRLRRKRLILERCLRNPSGHHRVRGHAVVEKGGDDLCRIQGSQPNLLVKRALIRNALLRVLTDALEKQSLPKWCERLRANPARGLQLLFPSRTEHKCCSAPNTPLTNWGERFVVGEVGWEQTMSDAGYIIGSTPRNAGTYCAGGRSGKVPCPELAWDMALGAGSDDASGLHRGAVADGCAGQSHRPLQRHRKKGRE